MILLFIPWGCKPLQLLQSFPNSSLGDPMLSLMAGYEHSHLYLSGSGRASQETAISGYCQQGLLGISNSDWVWRLHLGWIPRWESLWMAFSSVSAPHFVPVFPLDRSNSGLKILRRVGVPIPPLLVHPPASLSWHSPTLGHQPIQAQGPLLPLMSIPCYICSLHHGSLHVYSLVGGLVPRSSGSTGWFILLFFLWGC